MRLPKSKRARIGLLILAALILIPALSLVWFQTLVPGRGVASAAELKVPQPSERPAGMGAGFQSASFTQDGPSDGPGIDINPNPHRMGDAGAGRDIFRFETFGNEGFWTDGLRWLKGVREARVTPLQVLAAGMLIDAERVEPELLARLSAEARTDLSPARAPLLNDSGALLRIVEMNALVGVPAKDSNGDGRVDLAGGDKAGVSCAICHTVGDGTCRPDTSPCW